MCESIEQNKGRVVDWENIQWDVFKRHVRRLQERIFRATRDKDWARVKNLQKLLVRSHSARLLAVKRITQENKGKYTPGIDGQIYSTSEQRMELVDDVCQTNEKPGVKQRRCDLMGFWGASPVQGNLHAGFLKEEEDGNILSLFN
ncbi:hypothetical protein LCGC14_2195370 [marine sediment metagenome]|uniref:Reverse transcriptase N-terminal domain-containing protein n=1 Tax=marine sediment metagenome TaxID=412755 RepID=A0A0F9DIB5_9ZZZZ